MCEYTPMLFNIPVNTNSIFTDAIDERSTLIVQIRFQSKEKISPNPWRKRADSRVSTSLLPPYFNPHSLRRSFRQDWVTCQRCIRCVRSMALTVVSQGIADENDFWWLIEGSERDRDAGMQRVQVHRMIIVLLAGVHRHHDTNESTYSNDVSSGCLLAICWKEMKDRRPPVRTFNTG